MGSWGRRTRLETCPKATEEHFSYLTQTRAFFYSLYLPLYCRCQTLIPLSLVLNSGTYYTDSHTFRKYIFNNPGYLTRLNFHSKLRIWCSASFVPKYVVNTIQFHLNSNGETSPVSHKFFHHIPSWNVLWQTTPGGGKWGEPLSNPGKPGRHIPAKGYGQTNRNYAHN